MAYDLLVTAPASMAPATARAHAEALAGLPVVRVHELTSHDLDRAGDPAEAGDPILVSIKLLDDDAKVSKLWRALVGEARTRGLGLVDPQAGPQAGGGPVDLEAAGNYPPAWTPSGPVAGKSIAAKAKHLLVDHLRPRGFRVAGKWLATRDSPGLRQGVYVLNGVGRRKGEFTIELVWTFKTAAPPAGADDDGGMTSFDGAVRIGRLLSAGEGEGEGGGDRWYAGPLERSFERARADLFAHGLPYLDRYASVAAIVDAYRSGELPPHRCFGPDPGWQQFNLALCCEQLGRLDEAAAAYRAVITDHAKNNLELHLDSLRAMDPPNPAAIRRAEAELAKYKGGPDDWVWNREQAARARLARLDG